MFMIDVDGVLKLGHSPFPFSKRTMTYLYENEIPHVLLSNACGAEQHFAERLSNFIDFKVDPNKCVLSTTPLAAYLTENPTHNLLIIGSDQLSDKFFSLFKNNYTYPDDVVKKHPEIAPQFRHTSTPPNASHPFTFTEVDSIIFFADSVTWYADIQVALDVVLNKSSLDPQKIGSKMPRILVSNPDITYADDSIQAKLTVGAEVAAFRSIYTEMTGKVLEVEFFGKPFAPVYEIGMQKLKSQKNYSPDTQIYMIGDSLQSDIRGGNLNGLVSVLVKTGKVKCESELEEYGEEFQPKLVFENIEEAIQSLMK